MTQQIALLVIGFGLGALAMLAYLDYKYIGVDRSKVGKAFMDMHEQGLGTFALSFIMNPPKQNLMKPAPKRAKLTVVKESTK